MSSTSSSTSVASAAAVCVIAGAVAWLFIAAAAPRRRLEDVAVARAKIDRRLRENHERAEQMFAALRSRAWNPVRDAKIRSAELSVSVTFKGKHGKYRARFDGALELSQQISVETLEEEPGIDPSTAWWVKQWADLAFLGAYQEVVNALPADLFALTTTAGGQSIVTTPEFRLAPQTSYRFDARGLVDLSGSRIKDKAHVWRFTWLDWGTGAVLKGWSESIDRVQGVAEAGFEYDKDLRFPALRRVIRRARTPESGSDGERFEATFEWGGIVNE